MCCVCDHNFRIIFGDAAFRDAVSAGGSFSPATIIMCEHTAQQREDFLEDEKNRHAHLMYRARREVLTP